MSFPKKVFALERILFFLIAGIAILALLLSCKEENTGDYAFAKAETKSISTEKQVQESEQRDIPQQWKDYWYAGTAEITSYKLEQARYGEMREGTAALIFVTEDFLPKKQVKADRQNKENIPVIKLNATKKFNTGIYPYSLMSSTFYPVQKREHAIKVSHSMQEWCGLSHMQLNNRGTYEIESHSYFESEADNTFTLPATILENELWTQLRLNPNELPTGDFMAIPDFSFTTMKHVKVKAYKAKGSLTDTSYTLFYPELNRELKILFSVDFPHTIEGWEETYPDGRGGKKLTTKGSKIKTIKSAYWGKNSNDDSFLRSELGLE